MENDNNTSATGEPQQPVGYRPTPADFDKYLPWACAQLSAEADVVMIRSILKAYQSSATSERSTKQKKTKLKPPSSLSSESETVADKKDEVANIMGSNTYITIESVYDNLGNLVQLKFLNNVVRIPAKVIKIIGLLTPYHKHLTNITINSAMHSDTIYELSKFLSTSHITEVCLDGAFLAEANYDLLLTECHLKYLSLSKCKINDAVVKKIADKLHFTLPASQSLTVLNLSSNRITDDGAKYLADVLRSNRQLSYLNLASNVIGDDGGNAILDVLQNFPLTFDELIRSRARYIKYLQMRNELASSLSKELNEAELKKAAKKSYKKQPSASPSMKKKTEKDTTPRSSVDKGVSSAQNQYLDDRAQSLAESKLGRFFDPFSRMNTAERDGIVYCYGNNALRYLNLAYNDLSYITLKKLYEVLVTQKYLNRTPKGLINVVIEGNNLPIFCAELQSINDIIESNLSVPKKMSEITLKKKSIGSKVSGKYFDPKNLG